MNTTCQTLLGQIRDIQTGINEKSLNKTELRRIMLASCQRQLLILQVLLKGLEKCKSARTFTYSKNLINVRAVDEFVSIKWFIDASVDNINDSLKRKNEWFECILK